MWAAIGHSIDTWGCSLLKLSESGQKDLASAGLAPHSLNWFFFSLRLSRSGCRGQGSLLQQISERSCLSKCLKEDFKRKMQKILNLLKICFWVPGRTTSTSNNNGLAVCLPYETWVLNNLIIITSWSAYNNYEISTTGILGTESQLCKYTFSDANKESKLRLELEFTCWLLGA